MEALSTQQVLSTLSRADLPEEIEDDVINWKKLKKKLAKCMALQAKEGNRNPQEEAKIEEIPALESSMAFIERRVEKVLHTTSADPAVVAAETARKATANTGTGAAAKKKRQKQKKAAAALAAEAAAAEAAELDRLACQGDWSVAGGKPETGGAAGGKKGKKNKKKTPAASSAVVVKTEAEVASEEMKQQQQTAAEEAERLRSMVKQQLTVSSAADKKAQKRQRQKAKKEQQKEIDALCQKGLEEALQRVRDQEKLQEEEDAAKARKAQKDKEWEDEVLPEQTSTYRKMVSCAPEAVTERAISREKADSERLPDFVPSHEWQQVLPGQAIPVGLKSVMDMQSGLTFAKFLDPK